MRITIHYTPTGVILDISWPGGAHNKRIDGPDAAERVLAEVAKVLRQWRSETNEQII
jgi:hypothetical protein